MLDLKIERTSSSTKKKVNATNQIKASSWTFKKVRQVHTHSGGKNQSEIVAEVRNNKILCPFCPQIPSMGISQANG